MFNINKIDIVWGGNGDNFLKFNKKIFKWIYVGNILRLKL